MTAAALHVVGGEQRVAFRELSEWSRFRTALVVRIERDPAADGGVRLERVFAYTSPPEHCPEEGGSHVFKAATFAAGAAYLCTQTEVLICDLPDFRLRRVVSLPCFNDLHHVTPGPDGSLWVAVTGLDAVAQLTPEGDLLHLHGVLGASPWERFSPEVDYRKVPTTKPHHAHPNHVFFLDGRPYVTRFEQRDAVPVDGGAGPRFALGGAGVHDGHAGPGGVVFTSVDGRLTCFGPDGTPCRALDLNSLNPEPDRPLGWCRGLLPEGRRAWVGFTRIRFTRLRQNVSWVRHGFRSTEHHRLRPTRIALYDLQEPALVEEIDVEPAGLNAVFSIHAVD